MADRKRGFAKKIEVVHWTYGSFEFVAKAAGVFAQNVLAAQHLPETLLRTRGEWVANMSGTQPSQAGTAVTMGLILVPEGTGSTVLWSPITDGDAPWLWWDVMHLVYSEQVTDVAWGVAASAGRRVLDSKAMRKVRNTELQIVLENATIAGLSAAGINAVGSMRVLSGS